METRLGDEEVAVSIAVGVPDEATLEAMTVEVRFKIIMVLVNYFDHTKMVLNQC